MSGPEPPIPEDDDLDACVERLLTEMRSVTRQVASRFEDDEQPPPAVEDAIMAGAVLDDAGAVIPVDPPPVTGDMLAPEEGEAPIPDLEAIEETVEMPEPDLDEPEEAPAIEDVEGVEEAPEDLEEVIEMETTAEVGQAPAPEAEVADALGDESTFVAPESIADETPDEQPAAEEPADVPTAVTPPPPTQPHPSIPAESVDETVDPADEAEQDPEESETVDEHGASEVAKSVGQVPVEDAVSETVEQLDEELAEQMDELLDADFEDVEAVLGDTGDLAEAPPAPANESPPLPPPPHHPTPSASQADAAVSTDPSATTSAPAEEAGATVSPDAALEPSPAEATPEPANPEPAAQPAPTAEAVPASDEEPIPAETPAPAATPATTPKAKPESVMVRVRKAAQSAWVMIRTRGVPAALAAEPHVLRVMQLLSKPVAGKPQIIRDSIGWFAAWTAFTATCVWVYMVFIRSPGVPEPTQSAVKLVESGAASTDGAP